jgi:hypothetical protein
MSIVPKKYTLDKSDSQKDHLRVVGTGGAVDPPPIQQRTVLVRGEGGSGRANWLANPPYSVTLVIFPPPVNPPIIEHLTVVI